MRSLLLIVFAAIGLTACGSHGPQGNSGSNNGQDAATQGTVKVYPHGSLSLDEKGWAATLRQVSGEDTDHAALTGSVMPDDAKEYCERDPGGETIRYGGKETVRQCVAGVLKQQRAKVYAVSADCAQKQIASTRGTFQFIERRCEGEYCSNVWKDVKTGHVLEDAGYSGIDAVNAQFQTLCPSTTKSLPAVHPINLSDAKALMEKYETKATAACDTYSDAYIEQNAKYDHKWDGSASGFLGIKFDKYENRVENSGVLTLVSNHLMLQNGFGAFARVGITCNYDTQNDKVIGFDIEQ